MSIELRLYELMYVSSRELSFALKKQRFCPYAADGSLLLGPIVDYMTLGRLDCYSADVKALNII